MIDWLIDWLIDWEKNSTSFYWYRYIVDAMKITRKVERWKVMQTTFQSDFSLFFIVIVVNCFDCICFFAWCTLKLKPGLSGPSWPVQNESLFPSFAISKKPYCFHSKTPTLQSLYRNSRGTNGQYRDPLFLLNLNDIDEVCLGHSEKIMALLCDFTLVIYRWFGISSTVWVIFWRTAR